MLHPYSRHSHEHMPFKQKLKCSQWGMFQIKSVPVPKVAFGGLRDAPSPVQQRSGLTWALDHSWWAKDPLTEVRADLVYTKNYSRHSSRKRTFKYLKNSQFNTEFLYLNEFFCWLEKLYRFTSRNHHKRSNFSCCVTNELMAMNFRLTQFLGNKLFLCIN